MDAIPSPGLKVLLVDDNDAILRALSTLLRVVGHSVAEARGAVEALSLFECRHFDLLISDINLGHESGLELIRSIRRSSEMPAIAISGQPELAGPCLAGGFSVFLDKPVTWLALLQAIRAVGPGSSAPERGSSVSRLYC